MIIIDIKFDQSCLEISIYFPELPIKLYIKHFFELDVFILEKNLTLHQMKKDKSTFQQFLSYFPTIELPVHLTDDSLSVFSKENVPIPSQIVADYIAIFDNTEQDEYTEYIPCFSIQEGDAFNAVVYWKAQLMNYEYHIVTFDKKGNFITGKVIGGTISNGKSLIKTVATIDEDWIIHIVSGEDDAQSPNYNPENSKSYSMEILSTGDIIFSLNEENEIF